MKYFYLILFISLSASANSTYLKAAKYHIAKKNFFTAAGFVKELIKKKKSLPVASKMLHDLLPLTGIYPYLDIPMKRLMLLKPFANIQYLIGKKNFFLRQDKKALYHFNRVNISSPFYLSSVLHLASLYEIVGNEKKTLHFAKTCILYAKK